MKIKHYKSFNIIYLIFYKVLNEESYSEIKNIELLTQIVLIVGMQKLVNDEELYRLYESLNQFERELLFSSIDHDVKIQSAKIIQITGGSTIGI